MSSCRSMKNATRFISCPTSYRWAMSACAERANQARVGRVRRRTVSTVKSYSQRALSWVSVRLPSSNRSRDGSKATPHRTLVTRQTLAEVVFAVLPCFRYFTRTALLNTHSHCRVHDKCSVLNKGVHKHSTRHTHSQGRAILTMLVYPKLARLRTTSATVP